MQIAHLNPDGTPKYTNHLITETSPYLRQHAHNPVNWYPWGSEALERARREGKPIHLSIGYAACHWCHVMAHESFEDEATARLLNENYINIKVDREERPDIDRIYQIAQQMITQRGGGWPLTMFLTHDDQRPFFGGTYFPREGRYGLPAFADLLKRVLEFYRGHEPEMRAQNAPTRRSGHAARSSPTASTAVTAASAARPNFPHPKPSSGCCATGAPRRGTRPGCSRSTWQASHCGAWPKAASATSSAEDSAATRSMSAG
jgi:uncharacterized protein